MNTHIIIYGSFVFCFRLRRAEGTAAAAVYTTGREGRGCGGTAAYGTGGTGEAGKKAERV